MILAIAEGSTARYLVKEQFVPRNLPYHAIGETSAVNGSIWSRRDGIVDSAESTFQADLPELRSDDDGRDEFLLEESLESFKFPVAEFVVRSGVALASAPGWRNRVSVTQRHNDSWRNQPGNLGRER